MDIIDFLLCRALTISFIIADGNIYNHTAAILKLVDEMDSNFDIFVFNVCTWYIFNDL